MRYTNSFEMVILSVRTRSIRVHTLTRDAIPVLDIRSIFISNEILIRRILL